VTITSDTSGSPDLQTLVLASFPQASRLQRVQALMAERGVDCLVAVGKEYATWLTGYSRYFAGISATVLGPAGEVEVVTSPDEAPVVERTSTASKVHTFGTGGFGLDLDPLSSLLADLPRVELLKRATRVGVAGLRAADLPSAGAARVSELGAELAALMLRKDRDEAEKIAAAYNLCLEAQAVVAHGVQEGASELELFTRAHSTAQVSFGEPVEFVSDLLSGPNSAEVCCPIAVAGPRCAQPGEPVVADIAVGAGGYWGDTCRTYIRGQNEEVAANLERLASLLDAVVAGMRPGARGCDIHASMSEALSRAFPGSEVFPHHGGHGIGLGGCDTPHLIPADETALEPGMILAVEPGAYFKGRYGIRLENEYFITPEGAVELNAALSAASAGPAA
jgi:Xaa-Pro aminopeptidase